MNIQQIIKEIEKIQVLVDDLFLYPQPEWEQIKAVSELVDDLLIQLKKKEEGIRD